MLEVQTLGRLEVRLNGKPVHISSRKGRSLLAFLALTPGVNHPRDALAERWWPDAKNPRDNLKSEVSMLRRKLGEAYLPLDDKNTIRFQPSGDFSHDAATLLDGDPGDLSTAELAEHVSMYKGEFLVDFYNPWDEWAELYRRRIRHAFERHIQVLLERLEAVGRWGEMLFWAEYWLAHMDSVELPYRGLMTASAGLGDMARLSESYQQCLDELNKLGLEPSPDTVALYQELLTRPTREISQNEQDEIVRLQHEKENPLQAPPEATEKLIETSSPSDFDYTEDRVVGEISTPLTENSLHLGMIFAGIKIRWRFVIEDGEQIMVGRSQDPYIRHINLSTFDASFVRGVSRRHAMLENVHQSLFVRDLGSTHGTIVNGQRLEKEHRYHLHNDDILIFGNVLAKVEFLELPL